MKIAIIADSHDNLVNLEKCFKWLKKNKIKTVIHCGDLCAPSTFNETIKNSAFQGKIHFVFGNVDGDHFRMTRGVYDGTIKNVKIYGELGEIKIAGKKIAFCHLPGFAKALAKSRDYDLVFYGHTHKPWEEKIGQCRLVNPGTLAGMFYKATFATYDTQKDKLELKILEKM